MTTTDIQNEIVEEFSVFDDWMDRYEYLIEIGNTLETYDDKNKTQSNLIQGCQSRVWLDAEYKEGKIYFTADSDAIITKGIIALLIRVFFGKTPDEILQTDLFFLDKIGLKENLSPTRANGLVSMIKNINAYAQAFKAKYEK
ncbi:MAG: SufE family protein [Bacteroidetes bacterium]|nr:MAG: SufE family protein [Bacteroidota bacterium]